MSKKEKNIAKINIKDFKNPDELIEVLNSAVKTEILVDLCKLKNNPEVFASVMKANISGWLKSNVLHKRLKVYDKSIRTLDIDRIINNEIISLVDNIKLKNYRLGQDIPNAINGCVEFLNSDTKSKVLYSILEKQRFFYLYAKQLLINTSIKLADSDEELVDILNSFSKVIEKREFFNIIGKIKDGIDNPNVKIVLNKVKRFNIFQYTEADIKNNSKERIRLLKDIAKTPSNVKNLNFAVTFSVNDLKELAPVTRFDFLKWYFRGKFGYIYRYWNKPLVYNEKLNYAKNKKSGLDKLYLMPINEEELTELLFSVGLKKNSEVVKFTEKYKCYKKLINGIPLSKKEVTAIYGRYNYYF